MRQTSALADDIGDRAVGSAACQQRICAAFCLQMPLQLVGQLQSIGPCLSPHKLLCLGGG